MNEKISTMYKVVIFPHKQILTLLKNVILKCNIYHWYLLALTTVQHPKH